jgi:hypothetical protein
MMTEREKLRQNLSGLAETFLSLTPELRQLFLSQLADSGSPEVADWLAIFEHFHRNLEK